MTISDESVQSSREKQSGAFNIKSAIFELWENSPTPKPDLIEEQLRKEEEDYNSGKTSIPDSVKIETWKSRKIF